MNFWTFVSSLVFGVLCGVLVFYVNELCEFYDWTPYFASPFSCDATAQQSVATVCNGYTNGHTVGALCSALCAPTFVDSVSVAYTAPLSVKPHHDKGESSLGAKPDRDEVESLDEKPPSRAKPDHDSSESLGEKPPRLSVKSDHVSIDLLDEKPILFSTKPDHGRIESHGEKPPSLNANAGFTFRSCIAHMGGKHVVFSAVWNSTPVVVKAKSIETELENSLDRLYWVDDVDGTYVFPTEEELAEIVMYIVDQFIALPGTSYSERTPSDILRQLWPPRSIAAERRFYSPDESDERRFTASQIEMLSLWQLVQGAEYVLARLLEPLRLFPRVIATCGALYAMEYVQPIDQYLVAHQYEKDIRQHVEDAHLHGKDQHQHEKDAHQNVKDAFQYDKDTNQQQKISTTPKTDRKRLDRLDIAMRLVDYFNKTEQPSLSDNSSQWHGLEPLHFCDMKLDHIGLTEDGGVRFLDMDLVLGRSALGLQLSMTECSSDDDCTFFDCQSSCNMTVGNCNQHVITTNVQLLCEKILFNRPSFGALIAWLFGEPVGLLTHMLTTLPVHGHTSLAEDVDQGSDVKREKLENRAEHQIDENGEKRSESKADQIDSRLQYLINLCQRSSKDGYVLYLLSPFVDSGGGDDYRKSDEL